MRRLWTARWLRSAYVILTAAAVGLGPGAVEARAQVAASADRHGPTEPQELQLQADSGDPVFAIGGAALWTVVAAGVHDANARAFFEGDPGGDLQPVSKVGWYLGRADIAVPLLGLGYLAGHAADHPPLAEAMAHSFIALLASGAVNGVLKVSVGRARPDLGRGRFTFDPFSLGNSWQSFPSGHVVVAFSLASSLDAETDGPVIAGLGYASATLVAWSRLYEDRHWLSDAVGGALVGALASWQTMEWLHEDGSGPEPRVSVGPGRLAVALPVPHIF